MEKPNLNGKKKEDCMENKKQAEKSVTQETVEMLKVASQILNEHKKAFEVLGNA